MGYVPVEVPEEQLFQSGMSAGINFDHYEDIPIEISGTNAPNQIKTFKDSGLRSLILQNINKCNFIKPTPVQRAAIPIVMAGRDLMACAQTGSGKTAAFLLPVIHNLLTENLNFDDGLPAKPHVVIMAPTRELAKQIFEDSRKFHSGTVLKSCVIYGGTSVYAQRNLLQSRKVHILVATPGRLMDLVNNDYISFQNVKVLILDEADRMLDMGFIEDIKNIVRNASMPSKSDRQTLMFSATFPKTIQELAREFLYDYLFLRIGIVGSACSNVTQTVVEVEDIRDKRSRLFELLNKKAKDEKVLVFVETKKQTDYLATLLCEEGVKYFIQIFIIIALFILIFNSSLTQLAFMAIATKGNVKKHSIISKVENFRSSSPQPWLPEDWTSKTSAW